MVDWLGLEPLLIFAILVALLFDFYNGLHDSANSIATVVATRALPVWAALILASVANFAGAFWGLEVANTVGKIILPAEVTITMVIAALLGAIFWSVITVVLGIPISSSHALVGGLIGAGLAAAGVDAIDRSSFDHAGEAGHILLLGAIAGAVFGTAIAALSRSRILPGLLLGAWAGSAALLVWNIYQGAVTVKGLFATVLFIAYSPFIGFCLAFTFGTVVAWIFHKAPPGKVKHLFRFLQVGSSTFYSLGHGRNDAQKTMGVIAALLLAGGVTTEFTVPREVIVACGIAIGLGTIIGGWKIVRTMGTRLTHLDTSQGFVAETSSALGLHFMAEHGVPVSTTHSITGAILGVGALQRVSAVSWGVARRVVMAWIITIPLAATVAALAYGAIRLVGL
ncbi:MAG TPA: inorganic phosphate transporter [Candidatus Thermoplasmatota archaeon]|nr:inorganic phosphate transporter [Candidatus Thermoplasmatota archaeon]